MLFKNVSPLELKAVATAGATLTDAFARKARRAASMVLFDSNNSPDSTYRPLLWLSTRNCTPGKLKTWRLAPLAKGFERLLYFNSRPTLTLASSLTIRRAQWLPRALAFINSW